MNSALAMLPQLVATVLLVAVILFFPGGWNLTRCLGLAITALAAVPFLVARYQLGKSFSLNPRAKGLVTSGIYSRIRNPLYVFSTLMILGAVIAYQKWVLLIVPALLVVVQAIRAHREARVLEAAFGDAYREYRKTTWF
jgi:protein-S-isoprenylcysteine O-methyltransferase Ste14